MARQSKNKKKAKKEYLTQRTLEIYGKYLEKIERKKLNKFYKNRKERFRRMTDYTKNISGKNRRQKGLQQA